MTVLASTCFLFFLTKNTIHSNAIIYCVYLLPHLLSKVHSSEKRNLIFWPIKKSHLKKKKEKEKPFLLKEISSDLFIVNTHMEAKSLSLYWVAIHDKYLL